MVRYRHGALVHAGGDGPPQSAGAHYVHSVWGETSKLTTPRALDGNPMILYDVHRGQPSGGFTQSNIQLQSGETVGGDSQTITGKWQAVDAKVGLNRATWGSPQIPRDQLDYPVSVVPGGKVWRVAINGNGKDVWIDCTRGPKVDWDFTLEVFNCRTFRLSGARWFITDIRKLAGGWPDEGGGTAWSQPGMMFCPAAIPDNGFYFLEGCDFDMNHGGAYKCHRTDGVVPWDSSIFNTALIIQNSRMHRIGSSLIQPEAHSDCLQFYGSSEKLRHLHLENFEYYTFYQGIYYQAWSADSSVAEGMTQRLYRVRCTSTNEPRYPGNAGQAPLLLGYEGRQDSFPANPRLANLHAEDVEIVFRADPIAWGNLTTGWSGGVRNIDNIPTLKTDYVKASTNIPLLWAYNNGADVMAEKANVDGDNRLPGFKWYNLGSNAAQYRGYNAAGYTGMGTRAPADKIGHNYVHIWDRHGNILTE